MTANLPSPTRIAKPLCALLLAVVLPGAAVATNHRSIESPHAPSAQGGYSQAVRVDGVSGLVFVSGQIPVDRAGDVPADFDAQCRLVWANVRHQLEAAGLGLDDVVKVTTYLGSREHAARNSAIRREVLGERRPALTVLIAGIYDPAWLLEIEVVAAVTRPEAGAAAP
jgi:2-iminobutanoate/2-iminopropanoate deaminase